MKATEYAIIHGSKGLDELRARGGNCGGCCGHVRLRRKKMMHGWRIQVQHVQFHMWAAGPDHTTEQDRKHMIGVMPCAIFLQQQPIRCRYVGPITLVSEYKMHELPLFKDLCKPDAQILLKTVLCAAAQITPINLRTGN